MKPLSACHFYTFVDTAYLNGRSPVEIAKQLCDGGSDIIQLRAKNSSKDEVRNLAEQILPLTRDAGIPLVINDYLDIAESVGAEICHLGQEDFFDAGFTHVNQLHSNLHNGVGAAPSHLSAGKDAIRGRAVPFLFVGLSTHAPAQAERAIAAGADYVAIGPIYATGTKPTAKPVTLDYVRWAKENISVPWFAIGGINLDTVDAVLDAGARRICVVSAILNSENISKTCSLFRKRLDFTP